MGKFIAVVLAIAIMFVLTASVFAVGPGKTIELTPKGAGKVVFEGKAHAEFKCNACHTALFKMKRGADKITMKDMSAGKYCGACHNGTKAFGMKDCAKCHKK